MRPIDGDFAKEKIKESDLTNSEKKALLMMISEIPTLDQPPNDPLTLAELREMDGEPVWVLSMVSGWALVDVERGCCTNGRGETAAFERYGELWLAYLRKPEEG